ncbi:hypothetical protein WJX77_005801 [Trebouxia sp. C0004]
MLPTPGGIYLMIPVMIQIMVLLITKRKQGLWLVSKGSSGRVFVARLQSGILAAVKLAKSWRQGCFEKEALHENLPATFNALERTAVKRILKHPDAAGGLDYETLHRKLSLVRSYVDPKPRPVH